MPNGKFTVAAAFGNVHGVYSPGNVRLEPQILHNTQKFISEKLGGDDKKPVYFVFHGGSGSSTEDIQYAIEAGTCVEINQCVGCTRQFFTKSFLGDDVAVLARSSGEEPASPRRQAGAASMAWSRREDSALANAP